MEIITTYVNSLFNGLPADERLDRAKEDLLAIMEEHYNDLKAEGKSENEAVGEVISQFGNIDELLEELDIRVAQPVQEQQAAAQPDNSLHLTEDEALSYISYRKSFGWRMAIGVMLCILAPATMIALETILSNVVGLKGDMSDGLALVSLFVLIAAAVSIFIINGIQNEKYERYENRLITLPESTAKLVEQKQEENKKPFALSISFGLIFIFFGLITIGVLDAFFGGIDLAEDLSGAALLALVSVGVMFMVKAGIANESYKHLLNIEKKIKKNVSVNGEVPSQKGKVASAVFNAVLWPLTVIIYLLWSFVWGGWSVSWIVFPVAGLMSGIMGAVVSAINGEE